MTGLCIITRCTSPIRSPFIHQFLSRTDKYAVYHYLVTRLVARPTQPALADLSHQTQHERDARKLGILEEALSLGRAGPIIEAALAAVRRSKRLAARAGQGETRKTHDRETE